MLAHAVQHAKIHYFSAPALRGRHVIKRYAIHFSGSFSVNIGVAVEIIYHALLTRHHRRKTQLKLRIIGVYEHISICRHKCIANVSSKRRTDWNILQIRVGTAQTPRRHNILVKCCMHIAALVSLLRQRRNIRIL